MLDDFLDQDPWTIWWQLLLAATALIVAAAIAFPRTVYDNFIWRYFWGPVVADGQGAACAQYVDGQVTLLQTSTQCQQAAGIIAEPGYTTVSTASYAVILLAFLVGVYLGLKRFNLEARPALFFALVPFMFLGGTMRVLEDATLAVPSGADGFVIEFPLTAILISPLIYFLVFFIAVIAIALGIALMRRDVVDRLETPVAAIGVVLFALALVYLLYLVTLIPGTVLSIPMFVITLVGATLATAVVWGALTVSVPTFNEGTGWMGPVIIWAHALDGFANVLSLDWADELGLGIRYDPKHVVNEAVQDITGAIQPQVVSDAIGTVWPFIPLKIAVAALVVWLFNDELMEDSPRFFLLLLVAVVAVGLGPGTRDTLRATFGI